MKILEIRDELVIAEVNGNVTTRPNTPYYAMKFGKYENKRIAYTFDDTCFIQETYDDRIFNCWCDGERLQLRQDLADSLMGSITKAEMYRNVMSYRDLFTAAFNENTDTEILHVYLKHYKDVKQVEDGFVIYGIYKIDYKGNAYLKRVEGDGWNSLCIVMQHSGHSSAAESGELEDSLGNMRKVGAITMTIIAKVLFLLDPESQEKGFLRQLPDKWQVKLKEVGGGDIEW